MSPNPAAAVRMLVIYSLVIPLAALVGWMSTNELDYGTLGFFGIVGLVLASPLLIRYHYPILLVGLGAPVYCFFLKGNPPLWQVITLISLGISIIDRTLNSDKRFISVPRMTWALIFALAVTIMTAELTGGIGLKALGGPVSGGKKYLSLFIGIGMYFALTSRRIPVERRKLYIALFFLSGVPTFIGDLFPFLPAPLNYINLLIPSSNVGSADAVSASSFGSIRFGAFSTTASAIINYMLVRYGLKGILTISRPIRLLLFLFLMALTMVGGFRLVLISYIEIFAMLFFLEGLHRTQMVMVLVFGLVIGTVIIVPFSDKLPSSMQRTISFIPFLKVDPEVRANAEGSKKWREDIWRDTWPKVPQYLLLGKGYSLSAEDFTMMGDGTFSGGIASKMDNSYVALAISGDYHSGPLSTLMPFGVWGAVAFLWVSLMALYIVYRNYRFGDPALKNVNTFLLVLVAQRLFGFFFLFGSYSGDVGEFAKLAGFSIALNWCIRGPQTQARVVPRINRMDGARPQPA
jgi:hypothetical protein